jgi:Cytochrome P460
MNFRMNRALTIPLLLLASASAPTAEPSAAPQAEIRPLRYDTDGRLQPPSDYREWIYLSSGIDMSYREQASGMDHSMFDNVFVDPGAYRSFLANGTWPDHTRLVMEVRGAEGKGSINQKGKFQTAEVMGLEMHVKDSQRFDGGWAFFAFNGTQPSAPLPHGAECYACHRQHGAVDTTFVQFYPTLFGVAAAHETLSELYRDEGARNDRGRLPAADHKQ